MPAAAVEVSTASLEVAAVMTAMITMMAGITTTEVASVVVSVTYPRQ